MTDKKEFIPERIVWNNLQSDLREIGLDLVQIDYMPGSPSEITAKLYDGYGMKFHSSEDPRARFSKETSVNPTPKKVIFSGPATTILWKDGTKTTVKCQGDDVFNPETGIALCYLKKMLGNKGNYNNIFRKAMKVVVTKEVKK